MAKVGILLSPQLLVEQNLYYKDSFDIRKSKQVDMPLNKEAKTEYFSGWPDSSSRYWKQLKANIPK